MKIRFTILIVFAALLELRAQVIPPQEDPLHKVLDSARQINLAPLDSAGKKVDHVVNKIQLGIDSVKNRVDSVQLKLKNALQNKVGIVDSIKGKLDNGVHQLTGKENQVKDSVTLLVTKFQSKLFDNKVTGKVDSLKNTSLSVDRYTGKMDSLQSINPLQKVQTGVEDQQSKIQKISNGSTGQINEKLSLLSKEAGGKGGLPSNVNLPTTNADIPEMNLPGAKLPDSNLNMPAVDMPDANLPDSPLNKTFDINLDLPSTDLNVKELNKLNELTTSTDQIAGSVDKVSGYTEDIKQLKEGNLDKVENLEKDVVSQLPIDKELAELQKGDALVKEQEAKIKSYKNPEAYEKQTLARAHKIVAQQMALASKELESSMNKVAKYQNTMGTVLSKKSDLPKKRDTLRKLKTIERMSPGITFQVQKPSAWLVDINPTLRYRLTLYWSIGAGWNERIILGSHPTSYNQTRIYGGRLFTDVLLFKGLSGRLEVEDINMFIPPQQKVTQDVGQRNWIWCYNVGIKKEFSFAPKVIGNVQVMYNLYRSSESNPYPSRFNVRFGFEPSFKSGSKKKQSDRRIDSKNSVKK